MELSVVIPTYNQAGLLRECLMRLLDQSLDPATYELVVVDDGSADATSEVIRATAPRVRGVRFPGNRGRSAARNAGIDAAVGRIIVFIDSDVLVRRGFLAAHLKVHDRHGPGTLSRGPVVLVPDVPSAATAAVPWLTASPAYLDTANAGVEKQALQRAGMFDEAFPGYGWEDFELGLRLRRLGVRRVFSREAAAFHIQPPPRPEAIAALLQKEEARARSAVYFYRKAPTLRTRLLIQATPVHRAVFWLLSGGGLLTPVRAPRQAERLQRRGLRPLAHLILRGALNRHYIRTLGEEFRRRAATPA